MFTSSYFFFLYVTASTVIYTLSLHDALPIFCDLCVLCASAVKVLVLLLTASGSKPSFAKVSLQRSEEHTSELQSHSDLVCRLLLEKKKKNTDKSYKL